MDLHSVSAIENLDILSVLTEAHTLMLVSVLVTPFLTAPLT